MTMKKIETDPVANTDASALALVIMVVLLGISYFVAGWEVAPATRLLTEAPVVIDGERQTWQDELGGNGYWLYYKCVNDGACAKALELRPATYATYFLWFFAGLAFFAFVIFQLVRPKVRDKLDDAKWLKADVDKFPEVKEHLKPRVVPKNEPSKPENERPLVPIGDIIEQTHGPSAEMPEAATRFRYNNLKTMYLTSKMIQEHILIQGASGSGKTSRTFNWFLLEFARRGDLVVLPDFKYPDPSGLLQIVRLFGRLGQPIAAVLPHDARTMRVPVLSQIETVPDGRKLAAVLMPTNMKDQTSGEFFKLAQQEILACYFTHVANSPTPTMKDVRRLTLMSREEALAWATSEQRDPEIQQVITRIATDDVKNWGGFITGIQNAMSVFADDRVARCFTAEEGKNLDLDELMYSGGLIYYGQNTDFFRTEGGRTLMRIFDNWLVDNLVRKRREALEEQRNWGVSVRVVYDEARQLGYLLNQVANTAAMRGLDISMIYGIQDRTQMEALYGKTEWDAIDANLGTQIVYLTGVRDEAAENMSRYLGEREIRPKSKSSSRKRGPNITSSGATSGEGHSVKTRRLVTVSEIGEWPKYIAVCRTKGTLPPALLAMRPTFDPKPKFQGLDKRPFTLDNQAAYDDWHSVMGDLTPVEGQQEALDFIEDSLPQEEAGEVRLVETLVDLYGDWVRALTYEGVELRKSNKSGGDYELNYRSLPKKGQSRSGLDLRNERNIKAFISEGWLKVPPTIEDDTSLWQWVTLTAQGLKELGRLAVQELENARYAAEFINRRKHLSAADPGLNARYEEAREILPEDEARDVVGRLLTAERELNPDVLLVATELVMSQFETAKQETAIPLSTRFDRILPRATDRAKELVQEVNLSGALPDGLEAEEKAAVQLLLDRRSKDKAADAALDRPQEGEAVSAPVLEDNEMPVAQSSTQESAEKEAEAVSPSQTAQAEANAPKQMDKQARLDTLRSNFQSSGLPAAAPTGGLPIPAPAPQLETDAEEAEPKTVAESALDTELSIPEPSDSDDLPDDDDEEEMVSL